MKVELTKNQIEAVGRLRNGNILCGSVGSGKTRTAVAYFFDRVCGGGLPIDGRPPFEKLERPVDLYVITTAKVRDDLGWDKECIKFGISKDPEVSTGGVKLTVDSWNNIANYETVKDAFFIFDEQRLVGSGKWVKAFQKISKQNGWILLSGTPGDVWLDYAPVFIANGFYRNRTAFIHQHVRYSNFSKFPKIEGYYETTHLENLRRSITVLLPDDRHTKRHHHFIEVAHDTHKLKRVIKDRWNIYEDRPIVDIAELFRVMRRLVNSDPDRIEKLLYIWGSHPRLIVFYNFNYELEALRALCSRMDISWSEWNGHKHQPIPDTKDWIYLVQYTAGAEGWNCTDTDSMVFFSLNYSHKLYEQAQGRIDRMNTKFVDLHYFIFKSQSVIDRAIWKSLSQKKSFNEAVYRRRLEKGHAS